MRWGSPAEQAGKIIDEHEKHYICPPPEEEKVNQGQHYTRQLGYKGEDEEGEDDHRLVTKEKTP
jgi:hypothetical protein